MYAGCIQPLVEVVKQPRSWVMAEGDRLMLHCQATLRDSGRRRSLSYQWVHDDSPIPGATSSTFTRLKGDRGSGMAVQPCVG